MQIAHRSGKSFQVVVNETLRTGLAAGQAPAAAVPYQLRASSLGTVRKELDLDRALALADALEDELVSTTAIFVASAD